ncbi:MAG: UTP--glucose-1-phosphate uridylyltransferase GalU [Alphaproteobacteria bacterium]|jgi:UTP--glucose-1-phosphate uridylyltransferase|nr:UTP--glucose-1-phosphate uridylyltransferase GalU [Alphaproteobacteria bacterium]MBP9878040.1 UTP--glucose-1-phosphate uridylyltransferase GalU [Alphaproteobacteria bacterium]
MRKKVKKAVFPVAGLGTRFLPATKSIPKEMLAVADKPLIQYAVDEAREAGIDEFIFVTSRGKSAIEDFFDYDAVLSENLKSKGKMDSLDVVMQITKPGDRYFYTRQPEALGLGHAVWCAHQIVGDEPFAVLLPDDLIQAERGCLAQMMDVYNQHGGNVVAIQQVPREQTKSYGVIDPSPDYKDGPLIKVKGLVEKPDPKVAPSNFSIIGRYILQPEVFTYLSEKKRGASNEIQLTDSMIPLIAHQPFHGFQFEGTRYDCGSKLGFLSANISYGLHHPDIQADLRDFMSRKLNAL